MMCSFCNKYIDNNSTECEYCGRELKKSINEENSTSRKAKRPLLRNLIFVSIGMVLAFVIVLNSGPISHEYQETELSKKATKQQETQKSYNPKKEYYKITTRHFQVYLPIEWENKCSYETNQTDTGWCTTFIHNASVNASYGGELFSILLIDTTVNYTEYPDYTVIGGVEIPNLGRYNIIAINPTDIQSSPENMEEYNKFVNDQERILRTLSFNSDYTFKTTPCPVEELNDTYSESTSPSVSVGERESYYWDGTEGAIITDTVVLEKLQKAIHLYYENNTFANYMHERMMSSIEYEFDGKIDRKDITSVTPVPFKAIIECNVYTGDVIFLYQERYDFGDGIDLIIQYYTSMTRDDDLPFAGECTFFYDDLWVNTDMTVMRYHDPNMSSYFPYLDGDYPCKNPYQFYEWDKPDLYHYIQYPFGVSIFNSLIP